MEDLQGGPLPVVSRALYIGNWGYNPYVATSGVRTLLITGRGPATWYDFWNILSRYGRYAGGSSIYHLCSRIEFIGDERNPSTYLDVPLEATKWLGSMGCFTYLYKQGIFGL